LPTASRRHAGKEQARPAGGGSRCERVPLQGCRRPSRSRAATRAGTSSGLRLSSTASTTPGLCGRYMIRRRWTPYATSPTSARRGRGQLPSPVTSCDDSLALTPRSSRPQARAGAGETQRLPGGRRAGCCLTRFLSPSKTLDDRSERILSQWTGRAARGDGTGAAFPVPALEGTTGGRTSPCNRTMTARRSRTTNRRSRICSPI
jgi:hypothetical protein